MSFGRTAAVGARFAGQSSVGSALGSLIRRIAPVATVMLIALAAGVLAAKSHHYGIAVAAGVLVFAIGVIRLEAAFAALVVVALLLPRYVGNTPFMTLLGLVTLLAFVQAMMAGQSLSVAVPFVAYALVFFIAVLHAGPGGTDVVSLAKYIAPPLLAGATALVASTRRVRRLFLLFLIGGCLAQLPFAFVAGARVLAHPGSTGVYADRVYGLLLNSKSLGDIEVVCGVLLVAMVLVGVSRPRLFLAASAVLFSIPVLGAVKAAEFMLPVGLLIVGVGAFIARPNPAVRRRARTLIAIAAVALPAFVIVEAVIYPSTASVLSSPTGILKYVNARAGGAQGPIPGRGVAVSTAVSLAASSSPLTALLGRGPGATNIKLTGRLSPFAQQADLLLTPAQETNSVWIPRMLVETGVLGVLALFSLLWVISAAAWRGARSFSRDPTDLALLLALPGIIVVVLIAALEDTVFSLPPVVVVFWMLLGIGVAAARETLPVTEPRGSSERPALLTSRAA